MTDKGKDSESYRRKATGPRFLRDAFCDATKDPRSPGRRVSRGNHAGIVVGRARKMNTFARLFACLPQQL